MRPGNILPFGIGLNAIPFMYHDHCILKGGSPATPKTVNGYKRVIVASSRHAVARADSIGRSNPRRHS